MKNLIKKIPGAMHTKQWLDLQRVKRRKWPENVWISTTNYCNNNCIMCSIDKKAEKHTLTVNQLAKWTWLKNVKTIGLWGGCGESTLNPQLESMMELIYTNSPFIKMNLFTNGVRLTNWMIRKVHFLNVSLNAATELTWQRVNRPSGGSLEQIIDVLLDRDDAKSKLSISMIVHPDNMDEMPDFVELGAMLSATVVIGHCMYHSWGDKRMSVSKDQSVYYQREKFDRLLTESRALAANFGVTLHAPPLFTEPHYICNGARVSQPMPICTEPYKNVYLTTDEYGKHSMVVCCSGVYFDIAYDPDHLDSATFQKLWHSSCLDYLRKTVNENNYRGGNDLCRWCKSVDRFDPYSEESYYNICQKVKERRF